MGFPSQEYWSGLPCPPPGNLPHPGAELPLQADSFPTEPPGKPIGTVNKELQRLLPDTGRWEAGKKALCDQTSISGNRQRCWISACQGRGPSSAAHSHTPAAKCKLYTLPWPIWKRGGNSIDATRCLWWIKWHEHMYQCLGELYIIVVIFKQQFVSRNVPETSWTRDPWCSIILL